LIHPNLPRDGDWGDFGYRLRVAYRARAHPSSSSGGLSFCCARSAE
jgi:hypothetical protein